MKHLIQTFGPDVGVERDYRRWSYMADDVIADSGDGLGAKFATDDDGTRHWPYCKLAWGADNTYTIVAAGANAIPIQDGGNSITVDGTITANLGATDNAVLDSIDTAVNGTLTVGSHAVTNAGTFAVQVDAALPAGTNAIGKLSANSGVDIGDVDVTSISAGSNLIGDVGLGVRTSGGATPYYNDGVCTETQIKASAGQIYMISAVNVSASVRWLQMFDNTSAGTTPGTTTPTNEWPIPTQGDTNGAGVVIPLPVPLAYGTGITFFISTAKGGGSAATADDVMLNIAYA